MFEIGNTPLVELTQIKHELLLSANIFAKLESFNPAGSTKDRAALQMVCDAKDVGLLSKTTTIIEPTSGNTGIGLAAVSKEIGSRCIIVMPDNMSQQRIDLIESYGAQVVLTPGVDGMKGSIDRAKAIKNSIDDSWIPSQFDNPSNWRAHYNSTGPEIWEQTKGKIDAFVAGIGTGGTITGVGKYLKQKNPNIKIIGVEPENSAVISGGNAGNHTIQGIGAGFIPSVLDVSVIDKIYTSSNEAAQKYFDYINNIEHHSCGISSGAALDGAIKFAKDFPEVENVVILCPDGIDRYR